MSRFEGKFEFGPTCSTCILLDWKCSWDIFGLANDAYMRHGYSHFFHKAMGVYMGGLILDANTLYVDICFFKPFLHT